MWFGRYLVKVDTMHIRAPVNTIITAYGTAYGSHLQKSSCPFTAISKK